MSSSASMSLEDLVLLPAHNKSLLTFVLLLPRLEGRDTGLLCYRPSDASGHMSDHLGLFNRGTRESVRPPPHCTGLGSHTFAYPNTDLSPFWTISALLTLAQKARVEWTGSFVSPPTITYPSKSSNSSSSEEGNGESSEYNPSNSLKTSECSNSSVRSRLLASLGSSTITLDSKCSRWGACMDLRFEILRGQLLLVFLLWVVEPHAQGFLFPLEMSAIFMGGHA